MSLTTPTGLITLQDHITELGFRGVDIRAERQSGPPHENVPGFRMKYTLLGHFTTVGAHGAEQEIALALKHVDDILYHFRLTAARDLKLEQRKI